MMSDIRKKCSMKIWRKVHKEVDDQSDVVTEVDKKVLNPITKQTDQIKEKLCQQ